MDWLAYYVAIVNAYNVLTRDALLMCYSDIRYSERLIRSALDKGYLEEHVHTSEVMVAEKLPERASAVKRKVDGKREQKPSVQAEKHRYSRTLRYYNVTHAGIDYLKRSGALDDGSENNWKKFKAANKGLKKRGMERLLGVALTDYMTLRMNYGFCYVEGTTEKYFFADAKTVKYAAQTGVLGQKELARDFDRGRYSGCVFSEDYLMVVYNNFEPGFSWSKHFTVPERKAVELFASALKREDRLRSDAPICACILVSTPRQFEIIYHDYTDSRCRKKSDADFKKGRPFEQLYIVPVSRDGVEQLTMIFSGKAQTQKLAMLEQCWNDSRFDVREFTAYSHIVPCGIKENGKPIPFAVENTLNLRSMSTLEDLMNKYPQYEFGLMCTKWIAKYYKAVFGDKLRIYIYEDFF